MTLNKDEKDSQTEGERQGEDFYFEHKRQEQYIEEVNSDRCLYFLQLLFKWILKYLWFCRVTAFGQWLAWMQYNLW